MLVQDRDTGAIVACEEDYAKELQREGVKKIIASEDEKKFEELTKLREEGKL